MPARKKVLTTVKLGKLEAGNANPAKVGQALGAHGINIMEFCRAYNGATEARRGEVVPAEVSIYEDRRRDRPIHGHHHQGLTGSRRSHSAAPQEPAGSSPMSALPPTMP